jgi:hypothetical protein
VGAAQADNPHMKAVPDITEREKASFAVAAWLWSNRIQRRA